MTPPGLSPHPNKLVATPFLPSFPPSLYNFHILTVTYHPPSSSSGKLIKQAASLSLLPQPIMMSSLMGSHRVALVTAMAVSGTVVLLALCRQRPFPASPLRSYISSEERKRERAGSSSSKKKKKKNKVMKKRVHFAPQVVELPGRENSGSTNVDEEEEENDLATLPPETVQARKGDEARRVRGMPANRVALYNGILQDRLRRMAGSY